MKHRNRRSLAAAAIMIVLGALASCAAVKFNTLPEPPPTAKLRVFVRALTVEASDMSRKHRSAHFGTPQDEFMQTQARRVQHILERTGIYEVVSDKDVEAVLGEQYVNYNVLERDNWAQAREIGRALHADYVMIITRSKQRGQGGNDFILQVALINTQTGKDFKSGFRFEGGIAADKKEQGDMIKATYRQIFMLAKEDMLAIAIRKGRAYVPPAVPAPAKSQEAPVLEKAEQPARQPTPAVLPQQEAPLASKPEPQLEPQQVPAAGKPALTGAPKVSVPSAAVNQEPASVPRKEEPPVVAKAEPKVVPPSPNMPGTGLIEGSKKDANAKKLVVYDLESSDQYRTVALILADALREEVFKLKQFVLVNREDLQKVLEEMALQQTGLIDEKQAVKTGKGLAANQVVTGRLGFLGKTFLMQAKRVDVETFSTLGIASTKFTEGQEDEVLNTLPEFVWTLAGQQQ